MVGGSKALPLAGFTTSAELRSGVFGNGTFGKRQQWTVDGALHAQPLFAPGIVINGGSPSNLLLVVTEHATIYALDSGDRDNPRSMLFMKVAQCYVHQKGPHPRCIGINWGAGLA